MEGTKVPREARPNYSSGATSPPETLRRSRNCIDAAMIGRYMKGNTESLRGGVGMGILHRLRGTPGKAAVPGFLLLCLAISTAFSTPPVSLDSLPTLVMFTPVSVDSDPRDHTLWVADQYLPRIAHIEGDRAPISVFAASRYGGGRPAGVALEPVGTGHLFISDPDLLRIVRVDPSGNLAGAFGTSGLGIDNP